MITGVVAGAAGGAGGSIAQQYLTTGSVSLRQTARDTAIGAVTGGAFSALGRGLRSAWAARTRPNARTTTTTAPTSAVDDTAQQALSSGRFTNGNFAPGKLESHYLKHADEYGAIGIDAYLARARSLLSTDVGNGIRGFTRANGDTVRFNVRTGEFAAGAPDGTIRTLFRPDDGLAYYLKQVPK
jgi:hypothetical protein